MPRFESRRSYKNASQSTKLHSAQLKREELDQKEEQVIAKMINSDKENKAFTGLLVKESTRKIFIDRKRALDNSVRFETEDDGANDIIRPGCELL